MRIEINPNQHVLRRCNTLRKFERQTSFLFTTSSELKVDIGSVPHDLLPKKQPCLLDAPISTARGLDRRFHRPTMDPCLLNKQEAIFGTTAYRPALQAVQCSCESLPCLYDHRCIREHSVINSHTEASTEVPHSVSHRLVRRASRINMKERLFRGH